MATKSTTTISSAVRSTGTRGVRRYHVLEFKKAAYWEGPTYHNGKEPEWHEVFISPIALIAALRWIAEQREVRHNRNLMRIKDMQTGQVSKDLHPGRRF